MSVSETLYTIAMGIETFFYILGIVFMIVMLLVMITVFIIFMRARSAIRSFRDGFAGKVFSILQEKNLKVASALGLTLAHLFIDLMKKNIAQKSRKKELADS